MLQRNLTTRDATGLPTVTAWTNNNSEYANLVLKQATQWEPQTMVDLIKTLFDVVNTQYKYLKQALILGKFHQDTVYKA